MWDWLTNAQGFMPRGQCGVWTNAVMVMYIASNVAIAGAYFTIPVGLVYAWKKSKKRQPRAYVILLFASFIFACGVGHIVDGVLPFWWPNYRAIAVWHILTAVVSWVTAAALPHLFVHEILKKGD